MRLKTCFSNKINMLRPVRDLYYRVSNEPSQLLKQKCVQTFPFYPYKMYIWQKTCGHIYYMEYFPADLESVHILEYTSCISGNNAKGRHVSRTPIWPSSKTYFTVLIRKSL